MIRTAYREDKWKFPFIAYTPKTTDKKLPLVIQLHGAGERGTGNDDLDKVDINGFAQFMDEEFEAIFVMPQCPLNSFWAGKVESIIEFIEQLKEEFPVDCDRVSLTGLSMGGYGTWFTAMAKPELFSAIAPVCGGGMAWNAGVLKMPVWAFHGVEDNVVSVTQSDEMVEGIKKNEGNVKYTRLDGVYHNVWINAYTKELIDWLISHKR